MQRALLFGVLGASLAAGCRAEPAEQARPDAPRVIAVGNHNNLYVVVPGPVGQATGFRFWQRDAAGLWHRCEPGRATPAAVAAWREHLLVFFPSGRWGRFGLARPVVEPPPIPAWEPAAACEDGLAADAFGYTAAGDPVFIRYADGAWSGPKVIAGVEREQMLAPQMVRFGGRLFLVWREEVKDFPGSGAPFRLRFLIVDAAGKVQGPLSSRLRLASAAHIAAAGERMVCLFRKPDAEQAAGRWFLATYATADEDWHETGPLVGAVPEGPLDLARAGTDFFAVALKEGRPVVAGLDVETRCLEPFAPVTTQTAGREEEAADYLSILMLAVAALVFLLLLVGVRREGFGSAAAERRPVAKTGPVPAPLIRRAGAVAVDYCLLGLFVVLPLFAVAMPDSFSRLLQGQEIGWKTFLLLEGIRVGVVLVYFTAAEGLFGRTPGKALMRIEVRTESGRRVGFWRAAVRTVLRPVDELPGLYLLGVLLIVTSPKPQRLGDRLARTLVVQSVRAEGTERSAGGRGGGDE